ncbi:phosphopyruvate hydratase [SAR86 cluster bacterium]|nr:phosphopyruvate hydratase [SAR86 cluster bacterium]
MKIKKIAAYEILDSRGNPTIAADVLLEDGSIGCGFVPSGASTGSREAIEKRDGGKSFHGKGVELVIKNAEQNFFPEFIGSDANDQKTIDEKIISLDGTENKENFGANIALALSLACCKASSNSLNIPLYKHINNICKNSFELETDMRMPVPMMNILNGGAHANNGLDFQEFMIQPIGFTSFKDALRCGVEVFNSLKDTLNKAGFSTAVGDEGGFAPNIESSEEALNLISQAIEESGYKINDQITFALDCAATEFYKDGKYKFSDSKEFSNIELIDHLVDLSSKFSITSIEDGLDENDWNGWEELTNKLGKATQLVGDDLFVTNKKIFRQGIDKNIANSILIKINQIGTLSETFETIKLAKDNDYTCVISHRSGETEDSFIADLAVGTGAGQIKTGAPSRSDRTSKYNRLLMIDAWEKFQFLGKKELN